MQTHIIAPPAPTEWRAIVEGETCISFVTPPLPVGMWERKGVLVPD